jgi:ParB family transcriptional regulator, chromosome partitioning protein
METTMVEGRRGLGRGLSALMGEVDAVANPAAEPTKPAQAGQRELPIELVRRNPEQPRRIFDKAELEALAETIRRQGVLQPILVRPHPEQAGEFQIVAGERRWRAAQVAGLRLIPAVVRELDDRAVAEIAIVENVQRVDLNAVDEAMGYRALIDRFGHTQDDIAQAVGKSRSHVANTLRLLQLPPEVQAYLSEGAISAGHARALLSAEEADIPGLTRQVIERRLSVRETEALARKPAPAGKTPPAPPRMSGRADGVKDADTAALEADLTEALGLHVFITDKGGRGSIAIEYATLEQLDDVCRRLSGQKA